MIDELSALRRGAAWAISGVRTAVALAGADQRPWLERIASNPVADLAPGHWRPAAFLDGKGRLRADARVLAGGDLLLDVPSSGLDRLLQMLGMYIIREKVELRSLAETHCWLSVLGPESSRVCAFALPEGERLVDVPGASAVLRSTLCGLPGVDLLLERQGAAAFGRALNAPEVSLAALQVVRLEHGVPWFAFDLAADVLPLEAGLEDHVSITKGCYPGQEVVARISNLGQVARRLVRLTARGRHELSPGGELRGPQGQPAGVLTSAAFDVEQDVTRALGFARRAFWEEGALVRAAEVELSVSRLNRPTGPR